MKRPIGYMCNFCKGRYYRFNNKCPKCGAKIYIVKGKKPIQDIIPPVSERKEEE